ncbi:phenylacetate--CoA ligase family protein [Paenibacillus sp. HB172176]|uniref:phenylacetate--CoA ligase family protein n=1 Tax=Paenibacillus sp. HB172176 TaxID=2493690 RepID=UPI001439A016|nr:phenylacetate--CoA ligase family protein [Paenibacillus sp. HB172176]
MIANPVLKRLDEVAEAAARRYPYYRQLEEGKLTFQHLPIMDKGIINANRELLEFPSDGEVIVSHTSGSTGTPFRCMKTREEQLTLAMAIQRSRRRAGMPLNGRTQLLGNSLFADPRMVSFYANQICRQMPHLIQGRCSGLYELAIYFEQKKLQVPDTLLCVQNWGEYVQPGQRKEIERIFGVPLLDYYGMEELWMIAYSGPSGNLQIDESLVYVEALDPHTLQPVPEGEMGELVVTSFVMISLPFLRYRTGDMGRILRNGGTDGPSLELMPFRQSQIKLPDRDIYASVLRYLDRFYQWLATSLGVKQFQLVQEAYYTFRLVIAGGSQREEELEEAASKLRQLLKKILLVDELSISVEWTEQIQPHAISGKCQPFVSLVP